MLVEEDVVVDHEQPLALDELVECACLKPDHVSGARVDVVAPGLAGIDRARTAHPVVRRRAGKHQEDVDRGRRDQAAIGACLCRGLIEIERIGFAYRLAEQRDRLLRQRIWQRLARLAGDDLVPDLARFRILPEIGFERLGGRSCGLRHCFLLFVWRTIILLDEHAYGSVRPLASDKGACVGKDSDEFVRSIARGFSIVEALGKPPGRHTLAEAAELAGLNRATARRILSTLVALKYCCVDGRYFSLRPRALGLGLSYLNALPYWSYAQRALEDLRNEVGESCALAVLDEQEIV